MADAEDFPTPANWPTSDWTRPLTPSGIPFPARRSSMSLSPKRTGKLATSFEAGGSPFLTHVNAEHDEGEEVVDRPSSPASAMAASRPPQYTVQYIGLAKGELGVLSKREVRCLASDRVHEPCD